MPDNDYGATGTSKGPGAASGIEPGDGSLRAPTLRLTTEYIESIVDSDLDRRNGFPFTAQERLLAMEVLDHRAMVKRLEEWAVQLDDAKIDRAGLVGPFIAAELRNQMKGDVK